MKKSQWFTLGILFLLVGIGEISAHNKDNNNKFALEVTLSNTGLEHINYLEGFK